MLQKNPDVYPARPIVNGRKLAKQLRRLSPALRALLAYEAETNGVSALTRRQSAQMFCVATGYITTVASVTEAERQALKCGRITLSKLHHNHKRTEVTDREIGAFIDRAGLGRVWLEIDRRTAPTRCCAAE